MTRGSVWGVVMIGALALGCSSPPSPPPPAKAKPKAATAEPAGVAKPAAPDDTPPAVEPASDDAWPIAKPELRRAPAVPDAVTVEEAGAEPRAALRFAPKPKATRSVGLKMTMEVAMTLGDKPIDPSVLPTVSVSMDVTPGAEADGATPYAFAVTSASREDLDGASERLKKAVDTAVEGMKDSSGRLTIDAQGRQVSADYGLPEVSTPGLRPSLAGFQQSFSQLFVVFPDEAVGVGARWASTAHFEHSGIPIEQRSTYTLEKRDGDTLTLAVEFEQSATGDTESPAGVALEDTRFGGRGSGTLTVRLDSPFPVVAEAKSRSRVSSSVTMGGQAQPVEMDLLSTLSIASAD